MAFVAAAEGAAPPDPAETATRYRAGLAAPRNAALAAIGHEEESEALAYSISGRLGAFLEPVVKPLGFDWHVATAIIGSFAAKEVFVAQMGIIYAVGDAGGEALRAKLRENYTPLQGFCMMLYCLLSLPCVATIAVVRRETGGWRYAAGMVAGLTLTAYAVTLAVHQIGCALGIGMWRFGAP